MRKIANLKPQRKTNPQIQTCSLINHVKFFEKERKHVVITYEKHDYLNTKESIISMEIKTHMKACYENKVRVIPV